MRIDLSLTETSSDPFKHYVHGSPLQHPRKTTLPSRPNNW